MSDPTTTTRRNALRILLGAVALGLAGLPGLRKRLRPISRWGSSGRLGDAPLGAIDSSARLGAAFLVLRPEEADPEALRIRLGLPRGSLCDMPLPLRGRLAASRRDDFRAGRVCELGGWTFSETELRLCALVHLGENSPGRVRGPGTG